MDYKLWTDKTELFEARINISGAKLSDTFCRLVVESPEWNLVFEGEIDSTGQVQVPIKQLKSILPEGTSGKLKLEVIADGTYFSPWEKNFTVHQQKKVRVEVVQKEVASSKKGSKVEVVVEEQQGLSKWEKELSSPNVRKAMQNFTRAIVKEGISYRDLKSEKKLGKIQEILNENLRGLQPETKQWALRTVIELLKN